MLKKKSKEKLTWLEIDTNQSMYNQEKKLVLNVDNIISIEESISYDDRGNPYVEGTSIKTVSEWYTTDETYGSICDRLLGRKCDRVVGRKWIR